MKGKQDPHIDYCYQPWLNLISLPLRFDDCLQEKQTQRNFDFFCALPFGFHLVVVFVDDDDCLAGHNAVDDCVVGHVVVADDCIFDVDDVLVVAESIVVVVFADVAQGNELNQNQILAQPLIPYYSNCC